MEDIDGLDLSSEESMKAVEEDIALTEAAIAELDKAIEERVKAGAAGTA